MNFSKFDTKRLREKHGALYCKDDKMFHFVTNSLIPTTIGDPSWNPFSFTDVVEAKVGSRLGKRSINGGAHVPDVYIVWDLPEVPFRYT